MAFNQSEKNEIEKIVKKEIKSFLDSNTIKQLTEVFKKVSEDTLVMVFKKQNKG